MTKPEFNVIKPIEKALTKVCGDIYSSEGFISKSYINNKANNLHNHNVFLITTQTLPPACSTRSFRLLTTYGPHQVFLKW